MIINFCIKNYRPISLLPIMYEVFANILLHSTIDYLQVLNLLQEKANEYNMPFGFAFVDYEKPSTTQNLNYSLKG